LPRVDNTKGRRHEGAKNRSAPSPTPAPRDFVSFLCCLCVLCVSAAGTRPRAPTAFGGTTDRRTDADRHRQESLDCAPPSTPARSAPSPELRGLCVKPCRAAFLRPATNQHRSAPLLSHGTADDRPHGRARRPVEPSGWMADAVRMPGRSGAKSDVHRPAIRRRDGDIAPYQAQVAPESASRVASVSAIKCDVKS